MKNIIIAGATGYLGSYLIKELQNQKATFKAIARNEKRLQEQGLKPEQIIKAEVTEPKTLSGKLHDADVVISTVGITRQKDGLTYMDVDFQANMNLLEEAKQAGVKKFIYVSVINGASFMVKLGQSQIRGGGLLRTSCGVEKMPWFRHFSVFPVGIFRKESVPQLRSMTPDYDGGAS